MQGLRIAEAISLRWQDVDLDAEVPTLTVSGTLQHARGEGLTWHGQPKSAASRRTIPLLTPEVISMLRRRRDERASVPKHHDPEVQEARETFVFLSPTGRTPHPDNINKDVRRALDRAGYGWATFHSLRHALSARLKQAGIPAIEAARFLGHTEAVSVERYSDRTSMPLQALTVADRLALPAPEGA